MNSLALASCLFAGSGTSSVENLQIATFSTGPQGGGRVLVLVPEANQQLDLNGDGDQLDSILHAVPLEGGPVSNLGVAAINPTFSSDPGDATDIVGFSLFENGTVDLNGDGDLFDEVAHFVDLRTGSVQNTEIEVEDGLWFNAHFLASWKSELGGDLNGDGDVVDHALEVHRLGTGLSEILSISRVFELGIPTLRGSFVWSQTHERYDGDIDLNGDGDALDLVPVYLSSSSPSTVLPLATGSFSTTSNAPNFAAGERWFVFGVRETAQGSSDLNGDGVVSGRVAHLHEPNSGTTLNLGVRMNEFARSGRYSAATLLEADYGGDQNGDGDEDDFILHVLNPATGALVSSGVESLDLELSFQSFGRFVSFRSPMSAGTPGDRQLHVFEVSTGVVHATGIVINVGPTSPASLPTPQVLGRFVAYGVDEVTAGEDLNGDGDQSDVVLHTRDLQDQTTTNHGVAISGGPRLGDGLVVFASDELAQGQDVDGDGSIGGFIFSAIDLLDGSRVNGGLSTDLAADFPVLWVYGRTAFALVKEAPAGADLNGDGDQDDRVLHRIVL